MKKFIVSALVIGTFGLYAVFQHQFVPNISAAPTTQIVPSTPDQTQPITSNTDTQPATVPPTSSTSSSNSTKTTSGSSSKTTTTTKPKPAGQYKDGTYTGPAENAYYGYVQVAAIISGGKLTDVQILQYPNDRRTSIEINSQAMPYLRQEAISAQSANINIVSGATDSSGAFRQSLSAALSQARNI